MQESYSSIGLPTIAPDTRIKYGQEESIKELWKKIINIEDPQKRKEVINKLLNTVEENSEINGFITRDEEVKISEMGDGFLLDDNELYYLFFDILRQQKNSSPDTSDTLIILHSIRNTLFTYFGGFEGNRRKRTELTSMIVTDDDDLITPSISAQKGQNCSLCVERASISHNFWLLTGTKSHYVKSIACDFGDNLGEYANDGHAFCIIEENGVYKLFDPTMQIYKKLPDNPIEKMLSGKPFEVHDSTRNKSYIYANAPKPKR